MFKNILSTFASNFLIAVCNLLIVIMVSQYLGAYGKGEQSLLITTIAFVLLFCNIVGGATLVYMIPRYENRSLLFYSYIWSILVCFIVFVVLSLMVDVQKNYVFHISVLSVISSFASINSMILLGKEKITARNIINLTNTLLVLLTLAFMFFFQNVFSIQSYITALYAGYGASFVVSLLYLIKYVNVNSNTKKQKSGLIKTLLKLGFYNQASHITQLMNLRLCFYILLIYIGKDSVGIFSGAIVLAESVWLITNSIATVQYAKIANSDDVESDKIITVKLLRVSLLMSFFLLTVLSVLPSSFYMFLFGAEFKNVNTLILLFSPGVLMYNFLLIIGHYFSGKGRYHINTIASIIGLVFTIVLSLWLVPLYSYYGAAIATAVSYIMTSLFVFVIFKRESTFRLSDFFPKMIELKEYKRLLINLVRNINEKD